MPEIPLFIPLRREYFEASASGQKTHEFRAYGVRWNETNCTIGREVTLSLGYGKQGRLTGIITGFATDDTPQHLHGWAACYGIGKMRAAHLRQDDLMFELCLLPDQPRGRLTDTK